MKKVNLKTVKKKVAKMKEIKESTSVRIKPSDKAKLIKEFGGFQLAIDALVESLKK